MRLDFLALLGGLLLPLAFAPFGFAIVGLLSFVLLFGAWIGASPAEALRRGFWFGLGQFGLGFYWIFISLNEFGGAGWLASSLLTALLVAFLALYPALVGWLAKHFFRTRHPTLQLVVVFPAVWVLVEWFRGWFLTGLPWLLVGYTQTDTALKGYAPVFGTFGVSLATTMLAGLILVTARERGWRRRGALLGILAILGTGALLERVAWTKPVGEPFRAAALQGNVAQEQKWLPEIQRKTIDLYVTMTREQSDARLVVWPETSIPAFYLNIEKEVVPVLQAESVQRRSDLLIGIPYFDRKTERYFNSLVAFGEHPGVYFKRHLVPFGEFLPLRPVLGFMLELLQIPLSDFASGDDRQSLLWAAGYPLAATVCYEDIFGHEARFGLPEAAYLVNVTNDAWFGDSIAPHQHWQMARMRAIESGRYMVRATNTGVSGIIRPDGMVAVSAPLFQKSVAAGSVTPMQGATPYVRFGDYPVISMLSITLLVIGMRRRGTASLPVEGL